MDEFWVGVVRIACVQPLPSLSLWSGCIQGYRAFLPCRREQTLFCEWWVATGYNIFVLKKLLHFFKRRLCLLRFFMHTKRHLKLVELFFCRCQVKGSKGIRLFQCFLAFLSLGLICIRKRIVETLNISALRYFRGTIGTRFSFDFLVKVRGFPGHPFGRVANMYITWWRHKRYKWHGYGLYKSKFRGTASQNTATFHRYRR